MLLLGKVELWLVLAFAAAGIALLVRHTHAFWLLTLLLIPIAIEVEVSPGTALTLPTDLMAVLLMLAAWLMLPRQPKALLQAWGHPFTRILVICGAWMLICCFASTTPARSFKWFAVLTWQFGAFFLLPLLLFQKYPKLRERWLLWLVPGALVVSAIIVFHHASSDFSFNESSRVVRPFFFDHGPYATFLGLLAAPLAVFGLTQARYRWLFLGLAGWFLLCIVLSFSRATWLGVALAIAVGLGLVALRRFPRLVLGAGIAGALLLVTVFSQGLLDLTKGGRYEQDSFAESFISIFHTQNNASNEERINRWVAASRMVQERPITGFGPNSFLVSYDPYQAAKYRTEISTDLGTLGNAHSEIANAAAEMGYPGLLLCLVYMGGIIWTLQRGYFRAPTPHIRRLYLAAACGLATYLPQFAVNNLLDQDELSAMLFLTYATLVSLQSQPSVSGAPVSAAGASSSGASPLGNDAGTPGSLFTK